MCTISVGILTFNRKEKVIRAIESVYKQSYKDFEIVICDSASTDGTYETIKNRFPDIKIFKLTRNYGSVEGKNFVLVNCSGKYIVMLDDDEYLGDNVFERVIDTFESDDNGN